MDKKELRRYIRSLKETVTAEGKERMSEAICSRILLHPKVMDAGTILAYWSLPDEVHTHRLVEELWRKGKRVLLPKVISDTEMTIHEYQGMESMAQGAFGIMEPTTPAVPLTLLEDLKVAIIPGMAFSPDGCRLGRGKGYYDRLLARLPYIYKIGVCYPFQSLDTIPHDDYDIMMDEVTTNIAQ